MGASPEMKKKTVTAGLTAVADKAKRKGTLRAGTGLNKFATNPVKEPAPPSASNFEEDIKRRRRQPAGGSSTGGGYGGNTKLG